MKSEVCELFLQTSEKFRWFIDEYFPGKFIELLKLANDNEEEMLLAELNDIWFRLPDNKFNIIENPEGWTEFLNIIES